MSDIETLILYHSNCFDGMCAAWAARNKYPAATFKAVNYNQGLPDVNGEDVIMVDFAYSAEDTLKILKKARSVRILDHHKTHKEELTELEGTPGLSILIDSSKSGGRLAWEAFMQGYPSHWLVDYTEDRDIWRHALPNTHEINAALRSYPMTFEVWDEMAKRPLVELLDEGKAILRYKRSLVETIAKIKPLPRAVINGHDVPCLNLSLLFSEVLAELAIGEKFAASWFQNGTQRIFQLRSREDEPQSLDVGEIAKSYGGGGHKHAAGFSVDVQAVTIV